MSSIEVEDVLSDSNAPFESIRNALVLILNGRTDCW